ncbi:MAG: AAA family ATPase [Acidimicrobiales bacterium]
MREDALFSSIERRESVVRRLEAAAAGTATGNEEEENQEAAACLRLFEVRAQTLRFHRALIAWSGWRGCGAAETAIAAHRSFLETTAARTTSQLGHFGDDVRRQAATRLGLRLAVVGKGGAGKTTISATLARLLARSGRRVLAADLDTCPGLAYSLGVRDARSGLPEAALERHDGVTYGWRLSGGLDPMGAVERFATTAPDGVAYLGVAKIEESGTAPRPPSVAAVLEVLLGLGEPAWDVIGDLEAGTTTPFERQHLFADRVVVVVGPSCASALAARRLLPLLGDVPTVLVANRFGDKPDHAGLVPAVRVPFDPEVADAERRGLSPLDQCPASPVVRAVGHLADTLLAHAAQEVAP